MSGSKFFFAIIFFTLAVLTNVKAAETPRHFVFLIHGISSTPNTFGALKDILKNENDKQLNHDEMIVLGFLYDTDSQTLDTNSFAIDLSNYMDENFKKYGGLRSQDKVSFIMHSQGGLIGTKFLLRSAMGDPKFHPEYLPQIESFTTLGTPFWGSKIAVTGSKLKALARLLGGDILKMFGTTQLEDMGISSPAVDELRGLLMEPFGSRLMKQLQENVRFIHIAGIPEPLKWLSPFVSGKNQFESDTAVTLPSTQMDFQYYVEDNSQMNKALINAEDFSETNFLKEDSFYPVNAFHFPIIKNSMKIFGIARIPAGCIELAYQHCPHPSIVPIVENVFNLRKSRAPKTDFHSFAFDLRVHFPKVLTDKEKRQFKIKIKSMNGSTFIGKPSEFYRRYSTFGESGEYRLYHTGYLRKDSIDEGLVRLTILHPKFKQKVVQLPVKKGRTTFLDLSLLN